MRIYTRAVRLRAALFVTDALRCCRVDPKGDRRGAAQRGRVRDLPTYLRTYLPLLYYGDTARSREYVGKPLSILGVRRT